MIGLVDGTHNTLHTLQKCFSTQIAFIQVNFYDLCTHVTSLVLHSQQIAVRINKVTGMSCQAN